MRPLAQILATFRLLTRRLRGERPRDATLNSRTLPSRAMLCELLDEFDAAPQPAMIKGTGGFAASLYLLHRQGWDAFPQAMAQLGGRSFLRIARTKQLWQRLFACYAQTEANGRALSQWVRDDYDPLKFAHWLDGNAGLLCGRIAPN